MVILNVIIYTLHTQLPQFRHEFIGHLERASAY